MTNPHLKKKGQKRREKYLGEESATPISVMGGRTIKWLNFSFDNATEELVSCPTQRKKSLVQTTIAFDATHHVLDKVARSPKAQQE